MSTYYGPVRSWEIEQIIRDISDAEHAGRASYARVVRVLSRPCPTHEGD